MWFLCCNLNLGGLKEGFRLLITVSIFCIEIALCSVTSSWRKTIKKYSILATVIRASLTSLINLIYYNFISHSFVWLISHVFGSLFSSLYHWVWFIYGLSYLMAIIPLNGLCGACLNFLPIYGVKRNNASNYKFLIHVLPSFCARNLAKYVLSVKTGSYWFTLFNRTSIVFGLGWLVKLNFLVSTTTFNTNAGAGNLSDVLGWSISCI